MKYKTWEAVKMLMENPHIKFQAMSMNGRPKILSIKECDGIICDQDGGKIFIYPCDEWELVPQPVSFMEAVKAYGEGKAIRCDSTVYKSDSGIYASFTSQDSNNGTYLNANEILHGEWFIEA